MVSSLARQVEPSKISRLVIEIPQVMDGAKGRAAAMSGGLVKLAMFTGMVLWVYRGAKIVMVTPFQWKGQLPKDVTMRMLREMMPAAELRRLELASQPDHVWDAVSIGAWYLGK